MQSKARLYHDLVSEAPFELCVNSKIGGILRFTCSNDLTNGILKFISRLETLNERSEFQFTFTEVVREVHSSIESAYLTESAVFLTRLTEFDTIVRVVEKRIKQYLRTTRNDDHIGSNTK